MIGWDAKILLTGDFLFLRGIRTQTGFDKVFWAGCHSERYLSSSRQALEEVGERFWLVRCLREGERGKTKKGLEAAWG